MIDVYWFIRFEDGTMDEDEVVSGFQQLINNGMAWTLQGVYGRTASDLIEMGLCYMKGGIQHDDERF